MTDEIETYEVRAVADALRLAARKPAIEGDAAGTARAILKALKLAQARAEKREQKRYRMRFIEWVSSIEADGQSRPPPITPLT